MFFLPRDRFSADGLIELSRLFENLLGMYHEPVPGDNILDIEEQWSAGEQLIKLVQSHWAFSAINTQDSRNQQTLKRANLQRFESPGASAS